MLADVAPPFAALVTKPARKLCPENNRASKPAAAARFRVADVRTDILTLTVRNTMLNVAIRDASVVAHHLYRRRFAIGVLLQMF